MVLDSLPVDSAAKAVIADPILATKPHEHSLEYPRAVSSDLGGRWEKDTARAPAADRLRFQHQKVRVKICIPVRVMRSAHVYEQDQQS